MIPLRNGDVGPSPSLEWKFSQVFGERAVGEEVQEVDIISAIEFDKSGEHLATGDRGGRVVLFERTDGKDHTFRKDLERMEYPVAWHPEFRYKTEFQSHEPEFDYLKSLEIEEKINKVRWCQTANGALFLLSTNDKTVKYWKVQEKKVKKVCDMNLDSSASIGNGSLSGHIGAIDFDFPPGGIPSLRLPVVVGHETNLVPRCRRIYAHAHDYHINSISNNSDGETFISADDLRINLWNLEISNQSFNIVDVKPVNMEDLTEVITSAEFHPTHCNTLAYSSSKGTIRLIDMRQSALCDTHAKLFEEHEAPGSRSFFTEIIASISDIKFGKDGRYILSRDYMTLKLWDLNMESRPVATFQVHEYLRPKLCDLYENDSIFDKFECCLSGDSLRVATGSYRFDSCYHIISKVVIGWFQDSLGSPNSTQSQPIYLLGLKIRPGPSHLIIWPNTYSQPIAAINWLECRLRLGLKRKCCQTLVQTSPIYLAGLISQVKVKMMGLKQGLLSLCGA